MEERLTREQLSKAMRRRLDELFGEYDIYVNYYDKCHIYRRKEKQSFFQRRECLVCIKWLSLDSRTITVYDEMLYFLAKEFGEEFGFETLEMDYETAIPKGKKPKMKINRDVAENILKRRLASGEISTTEYNEKMAYL